MDIQLESGKYVVAVSGGVDSVVLLDLLSKIPDITLIVAHYDHGIRSDSSQDMALVKQLAKKYDWAFYSAEGKLGPEASEALARQKRYEFLRKVKKQTGADAIVTAHHQDDLIETAFLNLLRGTGRRGLSSLQSTRDIRRPLLILSKADLVDHAQRGHLAWREDSTNADQKYLRNYVRWQIVPKLSSSQREQFLVMLHTAASQNRIIDELLGNLLTEHATATTLHRQWFITLPHTASREVLLAWLRQADIRQLTRPRVEQIVVLAKTLSRGKLIDVAAGIQLEVRAHDLALVPRER